MLSIKTRDNVYLIKNFLRYATASLLCRGLTFLIAPITIVFLSPAEFGLLSLTNSFVVIMTIITGLGLRHVLIMEYVHCNEKERTKLIVNIIIIYTIIAFPLFIFLLINQSTINHYFFCNQSSATLILISIFLCFFTCFIEFFQQTLQLKAKISLASKLQITAALCSIIFTMFFVVFFKMGIVAIITAQLLGMLITYSYYFLYAIKSGISLIPNFSQLKEKAPAYLKIGLPFIPGMICNWIMASGDRWFLAHYSTLENVGIYTLADACGSLFHIFASNSIAAVYLPYLLKKFAAHQEQIKQLEAKNKKIMLVSLLGAVITTTAGYFILKLILYRLLPPMYIQSIKYIWFTFIGYILLMGTYFASILIQFYKQAFFLAFSLIIPALCNCFLNRLLIPHYAIYGCLIATISAYFLYFIITLGYNYMLLIKKQ